MTMLTPDARTALRRPYRIASRGRRLTGWANRTSSITVDSYNGRRTRSRKRRGGGDPPAPPPQTPLEQGVDRHVVAPAQIGFRSQLLPGELHARCGSDELGGAEDDVRLTLPGRRPVDLEEPGPHDVVAVQVHDEATVGQRAAADVPGRGRGHGGIEADGRDAMAPGDVVHPIGT